jgi:hypothetical protein
VCALNWLRNPFGLERWAYYNTAHELADLPDDRTLYYVCNQWAYGTGFDVDRELFYAVVWEHLNVLAHTYGEGKDFYFAFWNDRLITEYVTKYRAYFPNQPGTHGHKIEGSFWISGDENGRQGAGTLLVPLRHFEVPEIERGIKLGMEFAPAGQTLVQHYMSWYYELLWFAKMLVENPEFEFYCSN